MEQTTANVKRGIYRGDCGNAIYISGPKARKGWDLDAAEYVPLCMVNLTTFIRAAETQDTPAAYKYSW